MILICFVPEEQYIGRNKGIKQHPRPVKDEIIHSFIVTITYQPYIQGSVPMARNSI